MGFSPATISSNFGGSSVAAALVEVASLSDSVDVPLPKVTGLKNLGFAVAVPLDPSADDVVAVPDVAGCEAFFVQPRVVSKTSRIATVASLKTVM